MRSRRVPVLKLGSRGPGGDARSLRLWTQAFAIVRKRPQSFAVRRTCVTDLRRTCRKEKIVAKRRTVVTFYVLHYKCVNSHRDRGGRGRETQNCRSLWDSFRVFTSQQCQPSQGSWGSWSRKAELSSRNWTRLGSSRLKNVSSHRDRGVVVAKRRTVVTFGLVSGLRVSKVATVTGIGGVVVAKRRTVVTFGLVSGLCVSKVSAVTGIGGVVVAKRRTVVTFGLVSGLCVSKVAAVIGIGGVVVAKRRTVVTFGVVSFLSVSKVSTVTGIGGVVVAKRRTVGHFGTRFGSSRLKSANRHRDRGGRGREKQNCRREIGLVSGLRVLKMSAVTGIGGSWSRNAELSSLLDSSRVFASQKWQQSQGSGGSWSRNAELSSLLDSSPVFASQKCQQS